MTKKYAVIGLGAMNVDRLYMVERTVLDGEAGVLGVEEAPGGSAANTIYALARLGVSSAFAGAVGSDAGGEMLVEDLLSAGVDVSMVKRKDGPTGTAIAITDRRGKRALYLSPGANDLLGPSDIDTRRIGQADFMHISSFTGENQFHLTQDLAARLPGSIRLSFSPGMLYARRGLGNLAPILARTEVIFLNMAELQLLTGKNLIGGVAALHGAGCRQVAVTLGKGVKASSITGKEHRRMTATSYVSDGNSGHVIEAVRVAGLPLIDSTGAGDAFATGFLYGLLRTRGPEDCGRLGYLMARFAMSRSGARAGLPAAAELQDKYSEVYSAPL